MDDLRKAWGEHNLDRRMQVCFAFKVLIVGEFGIWPYDRESATARWVNSDPSCREAIPGHWRLAGIASAVAGPPPVNTGY